MLQFILTTILMVSLGTIFYLVTRSLHRVNEGISDKPSFLDRLSSSELPEKIDAAFNGFLLKFLRKTKVFLMKIDNLVNDKLKKVSPNGNGKPKIDFKDLAEDVPSAVEKVEKTPNSDNN